MLSKNITLALSFAIVAGSLAGTSQAASSANSDRPALTTPVGITLQEVAGGGRGPGGGSTEETPGAAAKTPGFLPGGGYRRGDRGFYIADARGMTLYTYDKDTAPGKSSCVEKCAEAWPPALVSAGAQAAAGWTMIDRADGAKQWAYKGKPVYTFAKEQKTGESKGNGAAEGAWHSIRLDASDFVVRPYGIEIQESRTAYGYILTNGIGSPIYAYSGTGVGGKQDCVTSVCAKRWIPVSAPNLANPIGDFTLITRDEGTKQWAYKGKPLFTYSADLMPGDALGIGVSSDYKVAVAARNFIPAQAGLYFDPGRGVMLTTKEGLTLYRLDTSYHTPDGHGLPYSYTGSPRVGQAMGTAACDNECLKTWRPFLASADALPSGHWGIMKRSDGTRQWSYKDYALYSYAGDKKAGDRNGADTYSVLTADDAKRDIYKQDEFGQAAVRTSDTAATVWSYVEP